MCGFRGPRRWQVLASHLGSPTLSLHPRKEQTWGGGDKTWDLFSQVVAQKDKGWPPAPGLRARRPCHVGGLCLEEHTVFQQEP